MNKPRQCQVAGHEMNCSLHICTYKDCELTSKWVCADCTLEQLHSHGQQNQNHIMKQKQFLEFTISQSQTIFDQSNQHASLLQQCIKQLDQFVQSTVMFKKLLELDLRRIHKFYKISELENIMKIVNFEFLILQKHQIELIINLKNNQSQFDFTLFQDLLKQVIIQVQKLQQLITTNTKQNMQEKQQFQEQTSQQEKVQILTAQQRDQQSRKQEKEQIQSQKQIQQQQIIQEKGQISIQQAQQLGQQQISQANQEQQIQSEIKQVLDNNQKIYSDQSQISEVEKYLTMGQQQISQANQEQQIQSEIKQVLDNNQKIYSDYFDFESKNYIYTSQISEDEKYLAIGGQDCKLYIYDMNTKQQIKKLEFHKYVKICRFTKDSRYLMCGDGSGYLYCYDFKNNFDELVNMRIHQGQINDILVIYNKQIITCSEDKSIIITKMPGLEQNSQEDFFVPLNPKIVCIKYNEPINGIDFDEQFVIGCLLESNSISFFIRYIGKEIFQQYVPHDSNITQIKMIPNNKIISSDQFSLILWQIDYDLKLLKQIRKFDLWNYNFTFIDDSKIIIVGIDQVCICDDNFNLEFSQYHGFQKSYGINNSLDYFFMTRQINSTKYIIIPTESKYKLGIKVMKRN